MGSIPGRGTKIPQVVWCSQKKKEEEEEEEEEGDTEGPRDERGRQGSDAAPGRAAGSRGGEPGTDPPPETAGDTALPLLDFPTPSLQNWERAGVCCSQSPGLWQQPQGN